MLINLVILFIKDLLPIFILLCLVSTCVAPNIISTNKLIITLTMSMLGVFMTFHLLPNMSELFDGIGIEVIETMELFIIYLCLLFSSSYMLTKNKLTTLQCNLIIIGIVLFIVINTSHFIVFLDSYMANNDSIQNIIVGLIIGFGICLSFSALLYFSLIWAVKKEYKFLTFFMWAFFLSGHVSQVINLLQQVDIIQSSGALWDSSNIVKDSSEYGHLLHTLFGYEASPSPEFIILYLASLLIFLGLFFIIPLSNRQY